MDINFLPHHSFEYSFAFQTSAILYSFQDKQSEQTLTTTVPSETIERPTWQYGSLVEEKNVCCQNIVFHSEFHEKWNIYSYTHQIYKVVPLNFPYRWLTTYILI